MSAGPSSPPSAAPTGAARGATVVLFDIDGTLLLAQGAGRRAFREALAAVFGWDDDIAYINFSGATDLDVLDRILRRHRRAPAPGDAARFFPELATCLERTITGADVRPFPGVAELLADLAARAEVRVGIVTGNVEACARIKLRAAGLHDHFVLGAFGHEHADRIELARRALARVAAGLPAGAPRRVFLVGDTPSDIAAAHAIGARAIAVATGAHAADALRAAGADHVVRDLTDLPALRAMLELG